MTKYQSGVSIQTYQLLMKSHHLGTLPLPSPPGKALDKSLNQSHLLLLTRPAMGCRKVSSFRADS